MKTKLTFLLSLTFLFLFSGSVYGDDLQDGLDAAARGDYKTAYKLWSPLAEQGDAYAQHNLGAMYLNGQGVPQDYKEAVKWFRLSAEQGHGAAQSNLGVRYRNGQGVPQDYKEAVKWFRLSAKQGFTHAQSNLGTLYRYGQGVPQDYKEAVKWFRLSAEQGDAPAQYNLGIMFQDGLGVQQDYKEAVKWYRLSAEQGVAGAQLNLGVMYAKGQGVPQDILLAHKWFNLCGSNGDKDCVESKNIVEKEMTPSQIEIAQRLAEDIWVAHQVKNLGAVAYVYGRITYEDKHRIIFGDSKCHGGEQIFNFYTKKQNKDILNLEGKVVEIKYNQEIIRTKIIGVKGDRFGHVVMFTLGGYSIAQLIKVHEDAPYISIELIDSKNFTASDYFDVLENKWSLKNLEPALNKAKSICEKLK